MASSTLSLSQFPGNMDCQIVGNTDSVVNYQLTIAFGNASSADTSKWNLMTKDGIYKYWIEECSPASGNNFCSNWKTYPLSEKTECKHMNSERAILLSEPNSTNPRENAVFVKHYSTYVWKRRLDLRNYSCDGISFNPNLNISNLPMQAKAYVKIISSSKNCN